MGYWKSLIFWCILIWYRVKSDNQISTEVYENRLSRDFIPSHYNIYIKPNIHEEGPPFSFSGKIGIYFKCTKSSNSSKNYQVLTLTSSGLLINESSIKFTTSSAHSPTPNFKSLKYDEEKQFIHIETDKEFKKDVNYFINIGYSGKMNELEFGLFAAEYRDEDNKIKYLAATQLEPIGFRDIAPGFDEVDMKATFDVVVGRKEGHTSLSNTHIITTYKNDGWIHDVFQRTPIMTPYLLCIVVGDLRYLEAVVDAGRKLKVRSYSTPALLKYLHHPTKYYTYPIQKWLEQETKIPYSLKKIDHITLPKFYFLAMENWGLVTYRANVFAVSNTTSPSSDLYRCSSTIAHELAHMWYGNLVTCEWWTHVWIQEGMASYYNNHPLQALGWAGSELHQLYEVIYYLVFDQTNLSKPVRIQINKPKNAYLAFAESTYNKGGSLIRMLSQIMTEPVLKRALIRYLKTYQYSVANSDQFLQIFTEQAKDSGITYPDGSQINFKKLMDPWLDQKGFPLIEVRGIKNGLATVTQSRYFNPRNQTEQIESPYKYKWDVPIQVLTSESLPSDWLKPPNYWLKASQESIQINVPELLNSWFIINPNQKFYYRVLYDKEQRKALAQNILKLPVESRTQIIDDSFDLARNGYIPAVDAFDTTLSLDNDPSHNTWSVTLKHVLKIEPFFKSQKWYSSYKYYFSTKLDRVLNTIGYEFHPGDTISMQFLRRDAICSSCWFGNLKCLKYAHQQFEEHKLKPELNTINANILKMVLCLEVERDPENNFEFVKKEYEKRKFSFILHERASYAYAMTCSSRKSDIEFIFKEIVNNGTFYHTDDIYEVANMLSSNSYGAQMLWKYLDEFGNVAMMIKIKSAITMSWYTSDQLEELKSFISRQPNKSLFSHDVLQVEQNFMFYQQNVEQLGIWFRDKQGRNNMVSMATSPLETMFVDHVVNMLPLDMWNEKLDMSNDKLFFGK